MKTFKEQLLEMKVRGKPLVIEFSKWKYQSHPKHLIANYKKWKNFDAEFTIKSYEEYYIIYRLK